MDLRKETELVKAAAETMLREDPKLANNFSARLESILESFTNSLKQNEMLTMHYESPSGEKYFVSNITWENPDLIILFSTDKDNVETAIIINTSEVVLILKKRDKSEIKDGVIGFRQTK